MRPIRFVQYAVYVILVSLLDSALITLGIGLGELGEQVSLMPLLPMALAGMPYVALQVGVAAVAIKPLSLRRLLLITMPFLAIARLAPALASLVFPRAVRWVAVWLHGVASGPFILLVPVLILALTRHVRGRTSGSTAETPQEVSMGDHSAERQPTGGESARGPRWYYWDIGLAALPFWFGLMFDPWGILNYLGGLINVPFALLALMFSATLLPAALLCIPILLVRMLIIWPRHIRPWRRVLCLWGATVTVFAIVFVLPWVLRESDPFMSGFTSYVHRRADISAVQAWLGTLEPPTPSEPGHREHLSLDWHKFPPSIRRLDAWGTRIDLDDENRPMLRLSWGSGVMGTWGLVIGTREMHIPPSDRSRYGEIRTPIAPGAYVWREVR